jgi:hypothetical protein
VLGMMWLYLPGQSRFSYVIAELVQVGGSLSNTSEFALQVLVHAHQFTM